jgi:hypothetical protein
MLAITKSLAQFDPEKNSSDKFEGEHQITDITISQNMIMFME